MKPQSETRRGAAKTAALKAPDLPPAENLQATTSPIPDLDPPTAAVRAMQDSLDRMRVEAAERAKVQQAEEERRLARAEADKEEARRQEDAFVARIEDVTTREAMLEHIRRMRAGPPVPPAPPPLTEAMQKRLDEEQEAGRRALAAHQVRGR
jgi:hypothetical protein